MSPTAGKFDGLPFAPRDTTTASRGRKAARLRERHDRQYLAFVAGHRCCVPGCNRAAKVHHEPPKSDRANWHDHKTAPLCREHHARECPGSRHDLGLEGFQERYSVNLFNVAARLNEKWNGIQSGALVKWECDRCDGCGDYEGGPTHLLTRCEPCNGEGWRWVYKGSLRPFFLY